MKRTAWILIGVLTCCFSMVNCGQEEDSDGDPSSGLEQPVEKGDQSTSSTDQCKEILCNPFVQMFYKFLKGNVTLKDLFYQVITRIQGETFHINGYKYLGKALLVKDVIQFFQYVTEGNFKGATATTASVFATTTSVTGKGYDLIALFLGDSFTPDGTKLPSAGTVITDGIQLTLGSAKSAIVDGKKVSIELKFQDGIYVTKTKDGKSETTKLFDVKK